VRILGSGSTLAVPFAAMRAPSLITAQLLRVAVAAAVLMFLSTVVSACRGSRPPDEHGFATAVREACDSYTAEMNAISRRNPTDRVASATGGLSTADFQAERRWLEQLRQLTPPASTGVTPSAWRNAIDVQLRDARVAVDLYGKEFAKVVRSWKRPLPAPKLPPDTGPTAATLAQAFNSPEGRRFLRLQNTFLRHTQADAPGWLRMLRSVGLFKICREPGVGHTGGTTTQLTTTIRP
jgi:hypothetical protein